MADQSDVETIVANISANVNKNIEAIAKVLKLFLNYNLLIKN